MAEGDVKIAVLETKMDAAEQSRARTYNLIDRVMQEMIAVKDELQHVKDELHQLNGFNEKAAAYGLHKGTEDQIRFVIMFWRWVFFSHWGRALIGSITAGLLYLLTMTIKNNLL